MLFACSQHHQNSREVNVLDVGGDRVGKFTIKVLQSSRDFLELVMEAGFETKQKTVMMFPVQVLSALFTREGHIRDVTVWARTRTPKYRDRQDPNVLVLFECIQSECVTSNPARKGAASGSGMC